MTIVIWLGVLVTLLAIGTVKAMRKMDEMEASNRNKAFYGYAALAIVLLLLFACIVIPSAVLIMRSDFWLGVIVTLLAKSVITNSRKLRDSDKRMKFFEPTMLKGVIAAVLLGTLLVQNAPTIFGLS
jgi:hypothetical protein